MCFEWHKGYSQPVEGDWGSKVLVALIQDERMGLAILIDCSFAHVS